MKQNVARERAYARQRAANDAHPGDQLVPPFTPAMEQEEREPSAQLDETVERAAADSERFHPTSPHGFRPPSRLGQARGATNTDLRRLADVSKQLKRLHRQEQALLRERDALVRKLRHDGESWTSLSSRTG